MKAMILAAGMGKRMLELTQDTPKPMLLINGKPMIEHLINHLVTNGFTEIVINLHYQADKIKHHLGDGSSYGVKISYSFEEELLNTGGGVLKALPLLGDKPFLLVSADIYTNFSFKFLKKDQTKLAHLVMVDNPSYNLEGDFALQGSDIILADKSRLTYANIGILDPKLFRDVSKKIFPLLAVLKPAIEQCKVTGEYYSGDWSNVGTPEALQGIKKEF